MMSLLRNLSFIALLGPAVASCGDGSLLHKRLFGSTGDHKKQEADSCTALSVNRIQVSSQYDNPSSGQVTYAYQYIPAADGQPTIVYIPGGPGQTSIGETESWLSQIPKGYGLVLTDPRGVGCNYQDPDQVGIAFFRSEYVARDILSAVKKMGLTNYSFYGISYGTLVATMAGSLAETETSAGWLKPKSVVLEGTLAQAFQTAEDADQKYVDLWHAKLAQLTLDVGSDKADLFKKSPLPLGGTTSQWGAAIRLGLMIGTLRQEGKTIDVTYELIKRAVSDVQKDRDWSKSILGKFSSDDDSYKKGSDAFYAVIACQEVFPDMRGITFNAGDFIRGSSNACSEAGLNGSRLFDSNKWQITAPIYYLDGSDDPATPALMSKTHFNGQTNSPSRQFLLINKGGHNPFELNMSDCSDPVWNAMTSNSGFKEAVKGCEWYSEAGFVLSTAAGDEVLNGSSSVSTLIGSQEFGLKDPLAPSSGVPEDIRLRSYPPVR